MGSPCWSWRSVCCNLKLRRLHLIEGNRQDWIGCWQAADARWNGREHVGFLPVLMQSDAIPGNYKQKNMTNIIRRICLLQLKWQYLLFSVTMHISTCTFKGIPSAFEVFRLNSVLNCSMSDLMYCNSAVLPVTCFFVCLHYVDVFIFYVNVEH